MLPASVETLRISSQCLVLLSLLLGTTRVGAQGVTTDWSINGYVAEESGRPLARARVAATRIGTTDSRFTSTDSAGAFRLLLPAAWDSTLLIISLEGSQSSRQIVRRAESATRLVITLRAASLDTVRVQRRRRERAVSGDRDRLGAADARSEILGTSGPGVAGRNNDPSGLVAFVPGLFEVRSADGTPGISLLGGSPSSTTVQLGSAGVGLSALPVGSNVNVRVTSFSADATRGGGSGAQIVLEPWSSSGWNGEVSSRLQPFTAQLGVPGANTNDRQYNRNGVLRLGTPIGTGATQLDITLSLNETGSDAVLLGARAESRGNRALSNSLRDSVLTFAGRVGIPLSLASSIPRSDRVSSGIVRLMHTASWGGVSLNVLGNQSTSSGIGADAFTNATAISQSRTTDGVLTLQGYHYLFGSFRHEPLLQLGAARRDRGAAQFRGPAALLQLSDATSVDELSSQTILRLGGNDDAARESSDYAVELQDAVSWHAVSGRWYTRLMTSIRHDRSTIGAALPSFGTVSYGSLAALQGNQPESFTRVIDTSASRASLTTWAVAASSQWRPQPALRIVGGLRLEASRSGDHVALSGEHSNSALTTPGAISGVTISPRLAMVRTFGIAPVAINSQVSRPRGAFTINAGILQGAQSARELLNARYITGRDDGRLMLRCYGLEQAPIADWSSWVSDPASVPNSCRDGQIGASESRPDGRSLSRDFAPPTTVHLGSGVSTMVTRRARLRFDLTLRNELGLPLYRDLNLREASVGSLASESMRPIFAPLTAIDPASGESSAPASRIDSTLGRIEQVRSVGRAQAAQMSISAQTQDFRRFAASLTYTHLRRRERLDGSALATNGDPRVLVWQPASLDGAHQFILSISGALGSTASVQLVARAQNGARFTPGVRGDLNSDGLQNDLAFLPAVGDNSLLAQELDRAAVNASESFVRCVSVSRGSFVQRNSCREGWQTLVNAELYWHPRFARTAERLSVYATVTNVLGGLDQLVHGRNAMRGWGGGSRLDRTLLDVTGFDAAEGAYRYRVNERFGRPVTGSSAPVVPFGLMIQASVEIGPDRRRAYLERVRSPRPGENQIDARIRISQSLLSQVRSPASQLRWGIARIPDLSTAQSDSLRALGDRFEAQAERALEHVALRLLASGGKYSATEMMAEVRAALASLQPLILAQQDDIRRVLTSAQLRALPPDLARALQPNFDALSIDY